MGTGIATTIIGAMMCSSDWASYYPWTLPGIVAMKIMEGDALGNEIILGVAGGVIGGLLAGWDVTRRDTL